jgi:hypothetical protein
MGPAYDAKNSDLRRSPDAARTRRSATARRWRYGATAQAQSPGEVGTELLAPVPDAFVGDHDATFGQDRRDVTQAETEDVVQPDCVADDLGRKPVPGIR